MASPNTPKTNRKIQRAEVQATWRYLNAPWTRRNGTRAEPCFERAERLPAPQFGFASGIVFSMDLYPGNDRSYRRLRNRLKHARRTA
jgi:hypothetical protein